MYILEENEFKTNGQKIQEFWCNNLSVNLHEYCTFLLFLLLVNFFYQPFIVHDVVYFKFYFVYIIVFAYD